MHVDVFYALYAYVGEFICGCTHTDEAHAICEAGRRFSGETQDITASAADGTLGKLIAFLASCCSMLGYLHFMSLETYLVVVFHVYVL